MLTDFNGSKCPDFCPNFEFTLCQYYDPAKTDQECGFCKQSNKYYRCLADVTRGIPLSYSSIGDFLTCHYLYYLKAIRGIKVRPAHQSSALKIGMLWDKVLGKHLGAEPKDDQGNTVTIKDIIDTNEIDDFSVAKVRAIYRAYKELEITVDPNYDIQAKIDLALPFDCPDNPEYRTPSLLITGYYDRKYPDYFVENKVSARPDNYLDPNFIQSQIGVYFLADPSLQSCVMEVIRTPDLKSTGRNKDEDATTFGDRVFQDILSRPSRYFIGYNRETHRYGKRYHRGEFNLDSITSRFQHIFREIQQANRYSGWYKNDKVCNNVLPGIPCDMLSICRSNDNMSEELYEIRKRKIEF